MKPTLIFMPGWGQSSQVWHHQIEYFSKSWQVQVINLPGHGDAPDAPVNSWVEELNDALPDHPCILIGWSLGGMLAIQLAHSFPEKFAGLVLLSSTPCFRARIDWKYGCSDKQFYAFEHALESDSNKLLSQFFTLMLHGDALSCNRFNAIAREAVDRKHRPLREALRSGLELLDTLDLRHQLPTISVPTLVMHGAHDEIVPLQAGRYLAEQIQHANLHIMACGHAPHLTQVDVFNEHLEQWCRTII